MFLTKKSKLVSIINELKTKLNHVNRTTDQELRLKNAAEKRMTKEIADLKQEVLKAKEVMMSTNLSIKAKRHFDDLVEKHHDQKIVRDDGVVRELM